MEVKDFPSPGSELVTKITPGALPAAENTILVLKAR